MYFFLSVTSLGGQDLNQFKSSLRSGYVAIKKDLDTDAFDRSIADILKMRSSDGSFSDVVYRGLNCSALDHLTKLKQMAIAYNFNMIGGATPKKLSIYSKSNQLFLAIIGGLRFWNNKAPNLASQNADCAIFKNWYFAAIGQQQLLGQILLIMDSVQAHEPGYLDYIKIRDTILEKYFWSPKRYQDALWQMNAKAPRQEMLGQNLIWLNQSALIRGLLKNSESEVADAMNGPLGLRNALQQVRAVSIPDENCPVSFQGTNSLKNFSSGTCQIWGKDGLQPDFSYRQHGMLYNGGYGLDALTDPIHLTWITWGGDPSQSSLELPLPVMSSPFAIGVNDVKLLARQIIFGTGKMLRGQNIDYNSMGRVLSRPGQNQNAKRISTAAKKVSKVCERVRLNLTKTNPQSPDISTLKDLQDKLEKLAQHIDGTGAPHSYDGNTYYWNSDFMTHQRSSFYSSVRMVSNREFGTEQVNGENLLGYWLPFGSNPILQKGDEYADIFPVWDWAHIPGVTASREVPKFDETSNVTLFNYKTSSLIGDDLAYFGSSSNRLVTYNGTFVGGVSNGRYGAAAIKLENLKGTNANKSWFFFDQEVVALGSGISSNNINPIDTTVNQTIRKSDVTLATESGNTSSVGAGRIYSKVKWVYHDGVGYFFPTPVDLFAAVDFSKRGNWNSINRTIAVPKDGSSADIVKDVFTLYLPHGKSPVNGSYEYIIVPGLKSTPTSLSSFRDYSSVKVLSNTKFIQAVYESKKKITQVIVYPGGEGQILKIRDDFAVSVDQPCHLILDESKISPQLTVADPEAKPGIITVKLSNPANLKQAPRAISVQITSGRSFSQPF